MVTADLPYEEIRPYRLSTGILGPIMSCRSRASFQQVLPNLFIGSRVSLYSPTALQKAGITSLLAVNGLLKFPRGFLTHTISIRDDEDEDISVYFESAIAFIKASTGGVLVFCDAGRSRSATIVAAYLIKECAMDRTTALEKILSVRSVNPNPGFIRQLDNYVIKLKCDLCRLEKRTKWLEETAEFVVMKCEQCDGPMVVLRAHTMTIDKATDERMRSALLKHAQDKGKPMYVDTVQRTIKDHLHYHARVQWRARL